MNSKLTLKLDKDIIDSAKNYAKKRNVSLSKMVEKYFMSLGEKKKARKEYAPLVFELSGIIRLDPEYDFKDDYGRYLSKKYK
jgi:hypothetical protein